MIVEAIEWAALAADSVGVLVILLGFLRAVVMFAPTVVISDRAVSMTRLSVIRCDFGTYLVFALELMIVSDLLHSVISQRLEDLYYLGAIVALRTVISYFLNQEIQELHGEPRSLA